MKRASACSSRAVAQTRNSDSEPNSAATSEAPGAAPPGGRASPAPATGSSRSGSGAAGGGFGASITGSSTLWTP